MDKIRYFKFGNVYALTDVHGKLIRSERRVQTKDGFKMEQTIVNEHDFDKDKLEVYIKNGHLVEVSEAEAEKKHQKKTSSKPSSDGSDKPLTEKQKLQARYKELANEDAVASWTVPKLKEKIEALENASSSSDDNDGNDGNSSESLDNTGGGPNEEPPGSD